MLDAVIDRHNQYGGIPSLAVQVRTRGRALITGVLTAFGARRAAAYACRDLGADLPTIFVVSPCQPITEFLKTSAAYRSLQARRQEERLKSTVVGSLLTAAASLAPASTPSVSDTGSISELISLLKQTGTLSESDGTRSDSRGGRRKSGSGVVPWTKGVYSDNGRCVASGGVRYSVAKGHAMMEALGCPDGESHCLAWQLTKGRTCSDADPSLSVATTQSMQIALAPTSTSSASRPVSAGWCRASITAPLPAPSAVARRIRPTGMQRRQVVRPFAPSNEVVRCRSLSSGRATCTPDYLVRNVCEEVWACVPGLQHSST